MSWTTTRRSLIGALTAAAQPFRNARAQDRTLRIVTPLEFRGIDPARGGYVFLRMSIAETLVAPDREGRLLPSLATAWTADEDGLTWRFFLRPDRAFHDGTPVTAEAVAKALDHGRRAPAGALRLVPVEEVRAEDGAVVFRLTRPFGVLPAYLADYSAIILGPSSYDETGRVVRIIGTGPYRASRIEGSHLVESRAVDGIASGGPAIQAAIYRAVPDGETRARMAEAGDAEIAFNVQPVAADRLRRNPRLEVASLPIPRTRFISLNARMPGLGDGRVRRALSLALDRAGVARAILRNPAAAADQLLPPFLSEWRDPTAAPLRYDPDAARRLLDEAGWRPGPDRIRTRDGQRLAFELFTYAARPELPAVAEAAQAQWRAIGVEARIRLGDAEDIPALHRSGRLQTALVARNYGVLPDPIGTLADDFLPASTVGFGPVGWRSSELEDAVAHYRSSTDASVQARLRPRIAGILQAEMPVIPHSWYDLVVAVARRVEGVAIDPFEASYGIPAMRWAP